MDIVQNHCLAVLFGKQRQFPSEQIDVAVFPAGQHPVQHGFLRCNVFRQLTGLLSGPLSAPLLINISGHRPHEAVEGFAVADVFR